MIGTTISHYRIIRKLGEGGMGTVYEAEDIRLGRLVALKFISHGQALETALERFRLEARVAARINHPRICTIHDVGEEDGQYFIAMELLEGQTLMHLLGNRPLANDRLLDLAIQTAEALDIAHSKGVVHRDLKPSNIFVTSSGQIKIMDFGLAKIMTVGESPAPFAANADLPTETIGLTSPGFAVGTTGFMAPEQYLGEEVDPRADIFSFGIVLYQMATGESPYPSSPKAAFLSAILEHRPEAPGAKNPALPEKLQDLILKALEKNREERYQSAREMLVDLRRIRRDLASSGATRLVQRTSTDRASGRHGTLVSWLLGATLVAAGMGVGVLLQNRISSPPKGAFERISLQRLTDSGRAAHAAISPDGRYFAYVDRSGGRDALLLRRVDAASSVEVLAPAPGEIGGVAFSPDGASLFYVRYPENVSFPGNVYRVPVLGGKPHLVVSDAVSPPGFSPNGRRVAFIRRDLHQGQSLLVVANAEGGEEQVVATRPLRPDGFVVSYGARAQAPAWSPDGMTIAAGARAGYAGLNEAVDEEAVLIDLSSRKSRALDVQNHSVGRLAWLPHGGLLLCGWDAATRELRGQIWHIAMPGGQFRRVTQDLSDYSRVDLSVSADGSSIAAVVEEDAVQLYLLPGGSSDRAVQITTGNRSWKEGIGWMADGRILAADRDFNLAVLNGDGTGAQPLVLDPHAQWGPTACGPAILFIRKVSVGTGELWRADLDGNNPRQLASGKLGNPTCTPDGAWAVLSTPSPEGKPSLYKLSTATGQRVQLLQRRSYPSAVSPDGAWVGITLDEVDPEPSRSLAVMPLAGGEPRVIARKTNAELNSLHWTPDGKALTYLSVSGGAWNIWRQPVAGGPPQPVTHFTSGSIFDFAWKKNGDLLIARGSVNTDVILIRDAGQ